MRYLKLCAAASLCCLSLTSCFKDEPLNAECDIEAAYLHVDNPEAIFFAKADDSINISSTMDNIYFTVKRNTDRSALAPEFKITKGATIIPASGSTHDFSDNKTVTYTVTSQDGNYKRTYNVAFHFSQDIMEYYFDNFYLNENAPANSYYVWSDKDENGNRLENWATGNAGFNLTSSSAAADEYPTAPASDGTEHATCVKLTTCDTGTFGKTYKMPIAAGNLFLGKFVIENAMKKNEEGIRGVLATEFGRPISSKPISFSGYYKYTRGPKFTDKNKKEVKDRKDYASIYAVLYDNANKTFMLHGDDVLTSDKIIATAIVEEQDNSSKIDETSEWKSFNINFKYTQEIDLEKLAKQGYSLAIVSSSSNNGAKYEGAIGSTLYIDDYSIKCE